MEARFKAKTVLTLAQRAAYRCSNPDCRKLTVGPNSEDTRATILGEAAHISGARQGAARFDASLTDHARADITNGIWLCANCHSAIDKDAKEYPTSLLFRWKEIHDDYVASELSGINEKLRFEERYSEAEKFSSYPPIIRRIVMDRPSGWEWSLTAELLRYLCEAELRRLHDLRESRYTRPLVRIRLDDFFDWLKLQMARMQSLTKPFERLIESINESWGKQGESGSTEEILHATLLIQDHLNQIVSYEEELTFLHVDDECLPVIELLRGLMAQQVEKILGIPEKLDDVLLLLDGDHEGTKENPLVISHSLTLETPDNWSDQFKEEVERLDRTIAKRFP